MKRATIGALVASAFMALLWTGIASAANGTLEICKAGDNGAAGQSFDISYAKGTATPTTVTVTGGTCNAGDLGADRHLHAAGGPLERPLGDERLVGRPLGQLGLRERPRRQAQGDGRRERRDAGDARQLALRRDDQGLQVERERRPAGRAVQLHRQRPDRDRGRRQERGERRAARPRSRPSRARKLKIQESVPSNETVASTTFNGASVANTAGLVKVTATTGANIVTFENEPVGPAADRLCRGLQGRRRRVRRRHDDSVPVHGHRQDQRRDPGAACSSTSARGRSRSRPATSRSPRRRPTART